MDTQRQRDVISSAVCAVIGLSFCIGSLRYGSLRSVFPNAGLFPLLGGIILIVLSLITLIGAGKKNTGRVQEKFFPEPCSWRRIILFLFALVAYSVALEVFGFLLTTFLFLVFLLKAIEPQRWRMALMTSLLAATCSFFLFEVLLRVQLPYGIFGRVLR